VSATHAGSAVASAMQLVPGRPLHQSRDARGVVFEPLDAAALAMQRNVHVVLSAPGAVRGNHYHRAQHEVTVVVGPARVAWRVAASATAPIETVDVPAGAAWRFEFPPGITHAFENTGRETQVLVAFASQPHDPANPDTFRDPLLEPRQASGPSSSSSSGAAPSTGSP
jgi:UDP-2-acetamido-2,6-beta-L-arabino-hexul-4-ose reductase